MALLKRMANGKRWPVTILSLWFALHLHATPASGSSPAAPTYSIARPSGAGDLPTLRPFDSRSLPSETLLPRSEPPAAALSALVSPSTAGSGPLALPIALQLQGVARSSVGRRSVGPSRVRPRIGGIPSSPRDPPAAP